MSTRLFTFGTSITFAVMAFIIALAALLITKGLCHEG